MVNLTAEVKAMSRSIELEATPKSNAEYKAAIENLLKEMERSRERMQKDQLEINRLQEETREILNRLKVM